MSKRTPEEIFAGLNGEAFQGELFRETPASVARRRALPITVRQVPGTFDDDDVVDESQFYGPIQNAHARDRDLADERALQLAERSLDQASLAGKGIGPRDVIAGRQRKELWKRLVAATDEADRDRLAREYLEFTRRHRPNKIQAAREEVRRYRKQRGLPRGGGIQFEG